MQLDTLELPGNLYWVDEFVWAGVAQSNERTVMGGAVIESVPLSYGQPITLTGAWATRPEVQALKALQAQSSTVRTLTLNDGSTRAVLFNIAAGGVEAELLSPELNPTEKTLYELTINLITVEPV